MKMSSKPTSSPSVSACFQEELVNTIHGAFQVAVEITVQEVTKLLVQKMGDLRGTVTHTQRENDTLKQRLQEAEEQLEILRAYVGADCSSPPPPPPSGGPSGDPEPVMEDEMMGEVKTEPEEDTDDSEDQDGRTFREICADGSVLSQQYHSETADPQQELSALSKTDCAEPLPPRTTGDAALPLSPRPRDKVDHDDDNMPGAVRPRAAEDTPSGTTHHARGTTTEDRPCNVQLVKIKVEDGSPSKEDAGPADCCFAPIAEEEADFAPIDDDELSSSLVQPKMEEEDDFGPDSLSLVQSQIMEEWKPSEMLLDAGVHSHRRPEPVVVPGSSRSLAHPSDLPQLSGVSAPDYSSPGDFSNMLTPGDMASTQGTSSSSSSVMPSNKAAVAKHRQKVNANPIEREKQLAKRRENYKKRKDAALGANPDHRPVKSLSEHEVIKKRQQWRENQRKHRASRSAKKLELSRPISQPEQPTHSSPSLQLDLQFHFL